jgi:hypothetical protein
VEKWNASVESISEEEGGDIYTGDVNGDGKLEIVYGDRTQHTVTTFSENGTLLHSFRVPGSYPYLFLSLLEDVTGDGIPEIFVSDNYGCDCQTHMYHLWIYTYYGHLLKTLTRGGGDGWMVAKGVVDLGNDGSEDIIVVVDSGYTATPRGISIFDYASGTEKWHYAVGPATLPQGLSVSDINNDSKPEFVLGGCQVNNGGSGSGLGGNTTTNDSYLWLTVFNENGYEIFTKPMSDNRFVTTKIVDLDHDGTREILVIDSPDQYYHGNAVIDLLSPTNGHILRSYTGPINTNKQWDGLYYGSAVADVNKDGYDEVIIGCENGSISVLNPNLNLIDITYLPNFPMVKAVNDINGDGNLEILATESHTLHVLDNNLNELWNYTFGGEIKTAIVSDLDNDGVNEIIVGADKLYVLGIPTPGNIEIGSNYIKNNKVYIAWDTTTAYGYNNNPKGVITEWKIDDNGNGDPADDENRIRGDLTGIEIGLQVLVGKYGEWTKWQRALGDSYPATISTHMEGDNGVVEITCNWTEYNFELRLKYTIKPNDSNLYADVSYFVYGPTEINYIRYGYAQICSIWVTSNPGEMSWFDYYKLSGQPEGAVSGLPSADNDLYTTTKPLYGSFRVSNKTWIQGLVPLDLNKINEFFLKIKTGGSYDGWAFNRDINCVIYNKTSIPAGTNVTVPFIWYAAHTNSYTELENIASSLQTGDLSAYLTIIPNKPGYMPSEKVILTAIYSRGPTTVTVEVDYPNGTPMYIFTNTTNTSGYAIFNFTLPNTAPVGTYWIFASTVDAECNSTFIVERPLNPAFTIENITIEGNLTPGGNISLRIVLNNTYGVSMKGLLVTQIKDPDDVPFPPVLLTVNVSCYAIESYDIIITLPTTASQGKYVIQIQLLSDLPHNGGYAYDVKTISVIVT